MAVMKIWRPVACFFLLGSSASAQTGGPLGEFAFSDGAVAGRFGSGVECAAGGAGRLLPVTGLVDAFTFQAWINPTSYIWTDFWRQMPDFPTATPIYNLSMTPEGGIYFAAYQGGTAYPISTVPVVAVNTWTHIAVTYDGAQIRIYFNGIEAGSRRANGNLMPSSQPMEVGNVFPGRIDEVRIYSRALSAAEIALDRATAIDPLLAVAVSIA